MDRLIRISYTNKATIGLPDYSNLNPSYTETRELHIPDDIGDDIVPQIRDAEFERMKEGIDQRVRRDMDEMLRWADRDYAIRNHRFDIINEVKFPHVSEVISPEPPPIPHLNDHGELGTHFDGCGKVWIDTGIWAYQDFKDRGNIKSTWDDLYLKMAEWIELYGSQFTFEGHSKKVINDDFVYTGEMDAWGKFGAYRAIFDFKKTEKLGPMKEKYYMQMAAYAKSLPKEEQPQCMVIISPFNEPVPEMNIDGYYEKFLFLRGEYKGRFGI